MKRFYSTISIVVILIIVIGFLLGVFCSRLRSMPIDRHELKMSIELLSDGSYLRINGERQNQFGDIQFPGYKIEPGKITIGFFWERLFPRPTQSFHGDWPLIIGPLHDSANGALIYLDGESEPLGHLQNGLNWTFELNQHGGN